MEDLPRACEFGELVEGPDDGDDDENTGDRPDTSDFSKGDKPEPSQDDD